MSAKIREYSIVRMKDGREGTVLLVYRDGVAYAIDFGKETSIMEDVVADKIDKVLWEPPQ